MYSEKIRSAIERASIQHKGQVDKIEIPYIAHVMRVAARMETEDEIIVALLHDVVEDSDYTLSQIEYEFDSKIAEAIDFISRRKKESYSDYILRVSLHPLATRVKIADLKDHLEHAEILPQSLCKRYIKALAFLRTIE